MKRFFSFPNPVNDYAARTVATGVVLLSVLFLVTGWTWLLIVLVAGFLARVASGPRFSPLGLLATKVVAPRFEHPSFSPGPPKRFAQAIGLVFSTTALVLALTVSTDAARIATRDQRPRYSLDFFSHDNSFRARFSHDDRAVEIGK